MSAYKTLVADTQKYTSHSWYVSPASEGKPVMQN